MKKIKYLSILILVLVMSVSCSDDSDGFDHPLIGKWVRAEISEDIKFDYEIIFSDDLTGTKTVTQTADGKSDSEIENFTWSTKGDILTMTGGEEPEILTYSILGIKLSVDLDSDGIIDLFLIKENPRNVHGW